MVQHVGGLGGLGQGAWVGKRDTPCRHGSGQHGMVVESYSHPRRGIHVEVYYNKEREIMAGKGGSGGRGREGRGFPLKEERGFMSECRADPQGLGQNANSYGRVNYCQNAFITSLQLL